MNKTHLYFLLRKKKECDGRAKEHRKYFHHLTSAQAQDLHHKRWSLMQKVQKRFSEALSSCCSFWLYVMLGICSTSEKQVLLFFKVCSNIHKAPTERNAHTTCVTYKCKAKRQSVSNLLSGNWSLTECQSNPTDFCLFLLSMQILVLTCTYFSGWSILSIYLPGRQTA